MSFKVKISHDTEKNSWDEMLLKSNFTYTYQTTSWQKMFNKVYNSKPIFISVTNPVLRLMFVYYMFLCFRSYVT